jgi:hypothetical protein
MFAVTSTVKGHHREGLVPEHEGINKEGNEAHHKYKIPKP